MKKMKSLNLARKLIFSVFLAATAITIASDGNNWTPLMALATGFMLYGEHRLNGEYRAEYKAWKKEQKNARSAGTLTSKKVIPFKNNSITIIDIGEGKVKCM